MNLRIFPVQKGLTHILVLQTLLDFYVDIIYIVSSLKPDFLIELLFDG